MSPFKLLLVLLVICSHQAFAQPVFVKGKVADTSEQRTLAQAVVSILRPTDSVLLKFSRVKPDGSFAVAVPKPGNYIVLITYPGYADHADIIEVSETTDLGLVNMITKAVLLQNVIVRGSAVRMKGDTLSFVADSFKVREGATVEDLLKKLPGLSVNSKGEITAQGQKVPKVLVDGDEFFGDDPTLATRNLQASAIKEVQVFDKKSDQATFTGVDDGQTEKTINLKLKDEFKKGYFGKVKLGGGLPNRWENQAMLNAFKDKRKLSVYGIMSNTNNNSLGWSDENQFGGNMNSQTEISEDGGIMMWSSGDEFGGTGGYYGEGLPTTWTAGTSYANKWNENRSNVTGAYRYQKMKTEAATTNNTQTILPDTMFFNNQRGNSITSRMRNKASGKTEIFIDSAQSVIITASGSMGETNMYNKFNSEALTGDRVPVNTSDRTTTSNGTNNKFDGSLLWRYKFKKKGRTLSANFNGGVVTTDSEGFLLTYNDFYKQGNLFQRDTIDQKKTVNDLSTTMGTRLAYSEPVSKNGVVEINYGFNSTNNQQERLSYDSENGKYDQLNTLYSNNFEFKTITNRTGAGYRYSGKKLTFGAGGDVAFTNWTQQDKFRDTTRLYDFTNFFPRANISYKLGQYSRLRINYNGSTQAPTANQLQPVANNNDPLNVYIGNPNLDQAFNHRFELNYNFWQVMKNTGMWVGLWYNPTSNAFSSRDIIDSVGRKFYQTVNVDGNYSIGGYSGYNFQWKKTGLNFDLNFNPNFNRNTNFVNGRENKTNNTQLGFGYRVSKSKEKKFYIDFNQDFSFNLSKSSIRPDIVTKYWTSGVGMNLSLEFIKNVTAGTDFSYNWRQTTEQFPNNNNAFIWNAMAEMKVLKKKDLKLGIRINDILNQNIGFNRNASSNYISESTYNVIRRYWMVTLHYTFNKGPQKVETDNF